MQMGGSIGTALDSSSYYMHDPSFESRQEHKKTFMFVPSQKCADSLSV